MTYYPQLLNAMIAQPGYTANLAFRSTIQDTASGLRTAWGWYGAGLANYPPGPLATWKIPYTQLIESERSTLEAFFATQQGRFGSFTFLDPAGNLIPSSEDFTASSWTRSAVTVTNNGGLADPYGGTNASLLTSSGDASVSALVLPAGSASGIQVCASVWALCATATTVRLSFVDSASSNIMSVLAPLPANAWTRLQVPVVVSTNNPLSFVVGGSTSWASGIALRLFGAQCSPSLGPGAYTKSPGNFGLHPNTRFDSDSLAWTKTDYNQNSVNVSLAEFYSS